MLLLYIYTQNTDNYNQHGALQKRTKHTSCMKTEETWKHLRKKMSKKNLLSGKLDNKKCIDEEMWKIMYVKREWCVTNFLKQQKSYFNSSSTRKKEEKSYIHMKSPAGMSFSSYIISKHSVIIQFLSLSWIIKQCLCKCIHIQKECITNSK